MWSMVQTRTGLLDQWRFVFRHLSDNTSVLGGERMGLFEWNLHGRDGQLAVVSLATERFTTVPSADVETNVRRAHLLSATITDVSRV
jgi:hypothetical protein